ncbi:hypothetical protein MASR2M69_22350 [Bacteroidota bacterium]
MFDFDKVVDRRGSSCFKYDADTVVFGREDILPMWVADMDFQSPPCVIDAARRLCDLGVLAIHTVLRSPKSFLFSGLSRGTDGRSL